MKPTERIRLKVGPTNVAVPQGYRDLQLDAEGNLLIESPDGSTTPAGGGSLTALEPEDIATGTITPKTGDIDFNNLGGAPTNAQVNTAIATDKFATQDALALAKQTSTANNRLFYTRKHLYDSIQASRPVVLRTLTIGDSWAKNCDDHLRGSIGAFGIIQPPGYVALAGGATRSDANWSLSPFGGQKVTLQTNTSCHVTFGKNVDGTGRLAPARYPVVFYEGAAGSSFTVQYEDAAGAWQTSATVATDIVATSGLQVWVGSALSESISTRVRVVWASGTPVICAAGMTSTTDNVAPVTATRQGLVSCDCSMGGSSLLQWDTLPQSSWNTLVGFLKPNIIYIRDKPEIADWTTRVQSIISKIRTAKADVDIVLIGRHITNDGSEADCKANDDWCRNYAENSDNCATFVDVKAHMPSTFAQSLSMGINAPDGVHLSGFGNEFVSDILFEYHNPIRRILISDCGPTTGKYGARYHGRGALNEWPIFFDGTLSGSSATILFNELSGGNSQNAKAQNQITQFARGGPSDQGFALGRQNQFYMTWDSQGRCSMHDVGRNVISTRVPPSRLEVISGSTSFPAIVAAGIAGQSANIFEARVDVSAASAGTTRFACNKDGIPVMPSFTTTARDALTSPPTGGMIFNTTTSKLNFYNGSAWVEVTSP